MIFFFIGIRQVFFAGVTVDVRHGAMMFDGSWWWSV
jgi:hypothetical protein